MIDLKNKPSEESKIKKEVLLLESPENAEAFRIMNLISPGNKKANILQLNEEIKLKKEFENNLLNKYKDTKLYNRDEITNECTKFNMYFAKSRDFRGEFSLELIKKITNFCQENKLIVSENHSYSTHIYLLGYDIFDDRDYGNSNFKTSQKDPLIFFRVEEKGEEFFILIDGNKSYKNLKNRFKGWFYYSPHNSRFIFAFLFYLFIFGVTYLFPLGYISFSFLFKLFMIPVSYIFGSFLNTLLYSATDPFVIKHSDLMKCGQKFHKKEDFFSYEPFVIGFLMIIFFWCSNSFILNFKLKNEGEFVEKQEVEKRTSKSDLIANKYNYDGTYKYYKKYDKITTYTPNTFFYKKEISKSSIKYTQKKRD